MNEQLVNKKEIQKVLRDFQRIAKRLIESDRQNGIANLQRFINFIESERMQIVYEMIQKCEAEYPNLDDRVKLCLKEEPKDIGQFGPQLPLLSEEEKEIAFTFQVLRQGLSKVLENKSSAEFGSHYDTLTIPIAGTGKIRESIRIYNKKIVKPLVEHIESYLEDMLIDNQETSPAMSNIQNNDFRGATLGGGVAGRDYTGDVIHNQAQQQSLTEAAAEIQTLLEQLSQTYPTETLTEQAIVAEQALDRIENNPTLKKRVIEVIQAMGVEAFREFIDHPVVNVLLAGIEKWKESK